MRLSLSPHKTSQGLSFVRGWRLSASLVFAACLSTIDAQTPAEHIASGDKFANQASFEKALEQYRLAQEADSSHCAAYWKISQCYVNLGEEAKKSARPKYYYQAFQWAEKAVDRCPDTPNSHFFLAVSSGRLAFYESNRNKIKRSKVVKDAALKTLDLDPNHHGAYHVLGRWHLELAGMSWILKTIAKVVYGGLPPGASYEKAIEYFNKAIEVNPEWIVHYRWLGEAYMKTEQWKLAREAFTRALESPAKDHEDARHKERCREFLEKLKNKN